MFNGISVVIPIYNLLHNINDVIDSITFQNFPIPMEIVIVDDGSEVLYKSAYTHNEKIRYLKKKNGGAASARNYGVLNSKYELICFLDADDVWVKGKIEKQYKLFIEYNLEFLGGGWNRRVYPFINHKLGLISFKLLPIKWWPHISTVMITKNLFNIVGGFDEKFSHGEDGDFLMKVAKLKKLYVYQANFTNTDINKHYAFESGLSSSQEKMLYGELKIINRYFSNIYLKTIYCFLIVIKYCIRKLQIYYKKLKYNK